MSKSDRSNSNCTKPPSKLQSYEMSTGPNLGKAVIFNNETFESYTNLENRKGTNADADAMKKLLEEIGFNPVNVYKDYTQCEALKELKVIAEDKEEKCDCFLAVFLSHGDAGMVLMKDGPLHIDSQILALFKCNQCPSLLGKPKIFFFQACRGQKAEIGVKKPNTPGTVGTDAKPPQSEAVAEAVTPAGADFLVCYATTHGQLSYRNTEDGSWFIKTFVKVIYEYRISLIAGNEEELDFLSLMTLVADVNSKKSVWMEDRQMYCIQMPCVVSTLKKRIYFPKLTKNYLAKTNKPESDVKEEDGAGGDIDGNCSENQE